MTLTVASETVVDQPPATTARRRRRPGVVAVLVLLAATVFLVRDWQMLTAPFGINHDGWNASVWATGSRALREEGPIASRLGTNSPELPAYATHPPLIYVETAVTEAVGGPSRAATRAPAWVGSLVALALLARLLLDRGVRPVAAGLAVVLTAATPMFLVYGTMLDTPVTSLPFGIGLLLLWLRARDGRTVHPVLAAGVAVLAVLAGWQSLLVAGVVSLWALARFARQQGRRGQRGRRLELAFAGGAAAGFAALVGWLLWAYGGTLGPLFAQYRVRRGQTVEARATIAQVLSTEWRDATELFSLGLLLLAAIGLVAALRDRRTRGLAGAVLAVVLPYGLVFTSGAVAHDYWNYWFLLPLAIGLAVGADRLLAARPNIARGVVGGGLALAAVMVLGDAVAPQPARRSIDWGLAAGRVLAGMPAIDRSQDRAWYADPAPWLALASGLPPEDVTRAARLRRLAQERPDDLVFVARMDCARDRIRPVHSVETAAEVAARPPVIRCP